MSKADGDSDLCRTIADRVATASTVDDIVA